MHAIALDPPRTLQEFMLKAKKFTDAEETVKAFKIHKGTEAWDEVTKSDQGSSRDGENDLTEALKEGLDIRPKHPFPAPQYTT